MIKVFINKKFHTTLSRSIELDRLYNDLEDTYKTDLLIDESLLLHDNNGEVSISILDNEVID